ncbi:MAG: PP2C family protein-serine/threonine phosphatase [Trueperaceae bacterium]|nr:MAG: PP2C family protein-serine/threonine phosphatase [Trueperaceae bacterium]
MKLSLRAKILGVVFAIITLCTVVFTWDTYLDDRNLFLTDIDNTLVTAAHAVPQILPDDFQGAIESPSSLTLENQLALGRLARYITNVDQDLENLNTSKNKTVTISDIYTIVRKGKDFYIFYTHACEKDAAAIGQEGEVEQEQEVACATYEEYPTYPQGLAEAWETQSLTFASYEDTYGRWRSAFIPKQTSSGSMYLVGVDANLDLVQNALKHLLIEAAQLGLAILVVIWLLSYLLLRRMLSPIGKLTTYTENLATSDFELLESQRSELSRIAKTQTDEIGTLAGEFVEMVDKLEMYVEDLKVTTAAKQRVEDELKIAHDIQMSFLKKTFPPFPECPDFDLFATIDPAKEVGGDLYDFSLIDDEHLVVSIGDVSDKGVPAALFMAVTMTLLKQATQRQGLDPADALRQINSALVQGNESFMFVTFFLGVLNLRTGELRYSNAGHNPPVVIRSRGESRQIPMPDGLVLGVMPDAVYRTEKLHLGSGDSIVLYTDGITEAMSPQREIYTEERLLRVTEMLAGTPPAELAQKIVDSVKLHVAQAPQSDDITLLTLKYSPPAAANPEM